VKIFFLFAPKFLEWPLAIARELKARNPSTSFSGLVSGPKKIFELVAASADPVIFPLDRLNNLERKWLSTPNNNDILDHYEAILGPGALKRIITADRQIGIGFVSGGLLPRTKLMELSKDAENIRRYVFGLLNYVFKAFEHNRPDIVFLYGVAGAASVALGEGCRYFGIPFARLTPARIGTKYIIDNSIEGLMTPISQAFKKAIDNPVMLKNNLSAAHKYLEQFRVKSEQPEFAIYVREKQMRDRSFAAITKQVIAGLRGVAIEVLRRPMRDFRYPTAWRHTLYNFRVGLTARYFSNKQLFNRLDELPKQAFAYFPLHLDPEASTMVLSPMHTDQIAVVEAISKSLPLGINLVVKEHIPMLGHRPRGYYKRLSRMPGVILISPFEDSLSLIKQASLTCVITGTAAWEAMLLQKPTLIIGNSPYMSIGQGFVYCPDLSSLPKAVSAALNLPPADDERLALYIAAILEQSFDFPTEAFWGNVTKDVVQQNQKILNNICDRILVLMEDRNLSERSKGTILQSKI